VVARTPCLASSAYGTARQRYRPENRSRSRFLREFRAYIEQPFIDRHGRAAQGLRHRTIVALSRLITGQVMRCARCLQDSPRSLPHPPQPRPRASLHR
jgi:hypothetical protein